MARPRVSCLKRGRFLKFNPMSDQAHNLKDESGMAPRDDAGVQPGVALKKHDGPFGHPLSDGADAVGESEAAGRDSLAHDAPRGLVYDRVFWFSYAANLMLVTGNAMTFRFAEFVKVFGGTERTAGFIVGCGTTAALVSRLVLGQAIDRFGVRRSWLTVVSLFIAGCAMMAAADAISPVLYVGRISFAIGLAGMFTCSIFHVQNRAPVMRRTEVIGNLGSSGFLGMIVGSQLCDLWGRSFSDRFEPVAAFGFVGGLGVVYLLLVLIVTARDERVQPEKSVPAHRLIFRFWPGPVAFAALAMGMYFIVPSVFLTRFSTHRGLGGISAYWTTYAVIAFLVRVRTRKWAQTVGRHRMVLIGTLGYGTGFAMMPFVNEAWHFIFPACSCGFAHALLFPAVVSLGTESFPPKYRGTGTTVVLGGTIAAPILGAVIDHYDGTGFPQMFFGSASVSLLIGGYYYLIGSQRPDSERLTNGG